MDRTFVIVGGGMTAASAVQALLEEGFDGRIVLVGEESHVPYERPPLSKEYLRGESTRDSLFLRDAAWYEQQGIDARLGARASGLDTSRHTLTLADGDQIPYGALLLATGGRPRLLAEPTERILSLRTIEDAERIRPHLGPGRHLLVVGAGFIGCEVAASARELGSEVTLLDVFDVPLQRAIGAEMGRVYSRIHHDHGVRLRMSDAVESLEERDGAVRVRTAAGVHVEGDAAVVGIAIVPNVELAESAGLEVENGVVVDELCRSSADGVFAAGDVANHAHPVFGRHVRVEHFDNALKQGAAAARSMLGAGEPFDDPHWFWSDQYDVNMQYAGVADDWDEIVVRGSVDALDFSGFYLKDGVVRAAIGLNRGRDVRRAMKLIRARARPDPSALRDEDVDLRTLASGG